MFKAAERSVSLGPILARRKATGMLVSEAASRAAFPPSVTP